MMSNSSAPTSGSELDPLLEDLSEAKQRFRRNVVSMAAELKELRCRLALTEQSYHRETLTRQEAEAKARAMEEKMVRLEKCFEEGNGVIQASNSAAEKYLTEIDELRFQLTATQATADASAASAQSAQLQCFALLKELDEKNDCLKEHEDRVQRLAEQLDNLQKDLQARELSQKQLKDEVMRVEQDIREAIVKAGVNEDSELRKILHEVFPENLEKMNKLLVAKDDEIANLKEALRTLSIHWKLKSEEMESEALIPYIEQLEKQRSADQELRKRVLKLEFCLQEAKSQTKRLQKMAERRDKTIRELKDQISAKQAAPAKGTEKQHFLESLSFKILVVSMSTLILVFSKR
ncbi:Nuclear envelope-associated protein 2-like protein [Drosera capensis]